jgi:hypothetical protein
VAVDGGPGDAELGDDMGDGVRATAVRPVSSYMSCAIFACLVVSFAFWPPVRPRRRPGHVGARGYAVG